MDDESPPRPDGCPGVTRQSSRSQSSSESGSDLPLRHSSRSHSSSESEPEDRTALPFLAEFAELSDTRGRSRPAPCDMAAHARRWMALTQSRVCCLWDVECLSYACLINLSETLSKWKNTVTITTRIPLPVPKAPAARRIGSLLSHCVCGGHTVLRKVNWGPCSRTSRRKKPSRPPPPQKNTHTHTHPIRLGLASGGRVGGEGLSQRPSLGGCNQSDHSRSGIKLKFQLAMFVWCLRPHTLGPGTRAAPETISLILRGLEASLYVACQAP
jgi:hypothetical protein